MRKKLLVCSVVACVLMAGAISVTLAADNWMGTWKLDAAASKFSGPAPKSQVIKFEAAKGGTMCSSETVGADGKTTKMSYVSKFDGSDVLWMGNPDADTSSPKRIDANNYENVWKKDGKETIHSKIMVSADGKTLTIMQMGADAKGMTVNNMAVYHR